MRRRFTINRMLYRGKPRVDFRSRTRLRTVQRELDRMRQSLFALRWVAIPGMGIVVGLVVQRIMANRNVVSLETKIVGGAVLTAVVVGLMVAYSAARRRYVELRAERADLRRSA